MICGVEAQQEGQRACDQDDQALIFEQLLYNIEFSIFPALDCFRLTCYCWSNTSIVTCLGTHIVEIVQEHAERRVAIWLFC
mgnify:CR=1 FL=1